MLLIPNTTVNCAITYTNCCALCLRSETRYLEDVHHEYVCKFLHAGLSDSGTTEYVHKGLSPELDRDTSGSETTSQ